MRILIGLTEVSGYYSRLKRGFDELGIDATHISLQEHRFCYSGRGENPILVNWAQQAVAKRLKVARSTAATRAFWLGVVFFTRLLLFVWSLWRFDVFILGGGSSFFSFREFPILRLLGKKVVYTLHGTDARPPYIDGFFDPVQYSSLAGVSEGPQDETTHEAATRLAPAHAVIARLRRRQVQIIEHNATRVVCGPSYCHFLTRPFVSFYSIGIPTLPTQSPGATKRSGINAPVRILHAPSNMKGKGTYEIRDIIAKLRQRGLAIEYVEIIDQPHSKVIEEIERCDLVIDQLYSDSPMAGFAAEAAMSEKAAVVGGYYSANMPGHVPANQIPPSAFCLPEELGETVAALVTDQNRRIRLGEAARQYVAEKWEAKVVAGNFLRIIEGDIPNDWMIDPRQVVYLHGIGQNERRSQANVAALMAFGGVAALQLSHRTDLESRFAQFAAAAEPPCSSG
jgi:glycosyltransferase involved in cell wall biosynthesis